MILLILVVLLIFLLFGAGSNFGGNRNTFLYLIVALFILWLILGAPR